MTQDDLVESFQNCALKQHQFTMEGSWRKANEQVKKMNELFNKFKAAGNEGRENLLSLTSSNFDEVALMAAVYSMKYNPDKSLEALKRIMAKNLPLLSSGARQTIQNWNNNEWHID